MFDDYGFKDGDFNLVLLSGDKFSQAKTDGVTKRASFTQRFEIPFQITPEWEITPLQIFLPTRSNTKPRVVEVDVASNQEREIQIADANYQYYWEVINEIGFAFHPDMPFFRIIEYYPSYIMEAHHPISFGELNAVNAFKDDLIVNFLKGIKSVAVNRSTNRKYMKYGWDGSFDWGFSPVKNPNAIYKASGGRNHFIVQSLTENDTKFSFGNPNIPVSKVHLAFDASLAKALQLDSVSTIRRIWDISGLQAIRQKGGYIVLEFKYPWYLKLRNPISTAKIKWVDSFISRDSKSIKFNIPKGKKIRFLDIEFDKDTNLKPLLWKEIQEVPDEYFITCSIVDNSTSSLNNVAVEFIDLFPSTGYKEYAKKKFRAVKSGLHVDISVDIFSRNQGRPKWWLEQTILVLELKKTYRQAVFQHAIQQ